jgi:hypothetical protein
MGQLALGVRSLLIRLAIFFVMAILLAWALGGTLWPRPVYATAIESTSGDISWSWEVRVSSYDPSRPLTYSLICRNKAEKHVHRMEWTEVAGIVFDDACAWTAASKDGADWRILKLTPDGAFESGESVEGRMGADEVLLSKRP